MLREGQPNRIQGLFRSFKRAEAQRNHRQRTEAQRLNSIPSQQEPQRRQSWENDPRLTQELKELDERINASLKEHQELRINQPSGSPATLEGWEAFRRKRRSEELLTTIAPLVPEQLSPGTFTKEKGKGIATRMYITLAREVAERQLLEAGNILQREVWRDNTNNQKTTIRRYGDMRITMNVKTGLVKDRSQIGIALSDSSEEKELYYGMGYFENEENFIPVARGSVRPEDLKKGAKAYFIERTQRGIKELIIIPCAYEEATSEFFDRLNKTAIDLEPAQANHRRHQSLAAA